MQLFDRGIHSKSPLVRRCVKIALQVPRVLNRHFSHKDSTPDVIANSFPKSGTHLLDQIVAGLPGRRNFGTFLSSMTGSYDFRERSERATKSFIRSIGPGELVRGHLFYEREYERALQERKIVHFFIYRDLRDVVLSEAYYLRNMNKWHKLHKWFRRCESMEDAISMAIQGLPEDLGVPYPNVGQRFARFRPWLDSQEVFCVRFEDLVSSDAHTRIREMVEWYAVRSGTRMDVERTVEHAKEQMEPGRSHTFRSGKSGGWQQAFTERHREEFKTAAGDMLIDLGYEDSLSW